MLQIAELYHNYGKKLFNLAYRMTSSRSEAEDIVHEVFIRVLRSADEFRGESSVYSWLFVITKNLCLRSMRRSFRGFEKLIEAAGDPSAADSSKGVEDELERRYYVQQVKEGCLTGLLSCLSFYQRLAFILAVLYGLSTRAVAAVLDRSENSVRILVSRAKAKLRAFLCANCSLYDAANRCSCENMVGFSLKNAWILPYDPRAAPRAIEAELRNLKSEVLLYQSLLELEPPAELAAHLMGREDLVVLSRKKVK